MSEKCGFEKCGMMIPKDDDSHFSELIKQGNVTNPVVDLRISTFEILWNLPNVGKCTIQHIESDTR